ncbi:MAG: hypothetical protein ACLP0J_10180 [Solirubrobacteraceae bacterium]
MLGILIGPGSVGAIVLYAVAGFVLLTSATGYCPLSTVIHLGGRTRRWLSH